MMAGLTLARLLDVVGRALIYGGGAVIVVGVVLTLRADARERRARMSERWLHERWKERASR